MKMVITLRSGVQIWSDVDEFTVGRSPLQGELRELKWHWPAGAQSILKWVDLSQVAAVHVEHDVDDGEAKPGQSPGQPDR